MGGGFDGTSPSPRRATRTPPAPGRRGPRQSLCAGAPAPSSRAAGRDRRPRNEAARTGLRPGVTRKSAARMRLGSRRTSGRRPLVRARRIRLTPGTRMRRSLNEQGRRPAPPPPPSESTATGGGRRRGPRVRVAHPFTAPAPPLGRAAPRPRRGCSAGASASARPGPGSARNPAPAGRQTPPAGAEGGYPSHGPGRGGGRGQKGARLSGRRSSAAAAAAAEGRTVPGRGAAP